MQEKRGMQTIYTTCLESRSCASSCASEYMHQLYDCVRAI